MKMATLTMSHVVAPTAMKRAPTAFENRVRIFRRNTQEVFIENI
jgi:hypothetical protein